LSDQPCDLVIKHEGILGGIASDVSHIKAVVDDGLIGKMGEVGGKIKDMERDLEVKDLETKMRETQIREDMEKRYIKLDSENWFSRILQGSVTKVIGIVLVAIILGSLVNNGIWVILKEKYIKELPGQQQTLLQQTNKIPSTPLTQPYDLGTYKNYTLSDGRVVFYTDDPTKSFIFDPKTNIFSKSISLLDQKK
jgi:hypothetical protein